MGFISFNILLLQKKLIIATNEKMDEMSKRGWGQLRMKKRKKPLNFKFQYMFEIRTSNFALLFFKEMKTLGLKPSVKVF